MLKRIPQKFRIVIISNGVTKKREKKHCVAKRVSPQQINKQTKEKKQTTRPHFISFVLCVCSISQHTLIICCFFLLLLSVWDARTFTSFVIVRIAFEIGVIVYIVSTTSYHHHHHHQRTHTHTHTLSMNVQQATRASTPVTCLWLFNVHRLFCFGTVLVCACESLYVSHYRPLALSRPVVIFCCNCDESYIRFVILHYLNGLCTVCAVAMAAVAAATLMSMNWVSVNVLLLGDFSQRSNFASTSRYCMCMHAAIVKIQNKKKTEERRNDVRFIGILNSLRWFTEKKWFNANGKVAFSFVIYNIWIHTKTAQKIKK